MERSLAPNPLRPRDAIGICSQSLAALVAFEHMASHVVGWPEDTAPQAFDRLEEMQRTLRKEIIGEIVLWARQTNRLWNQQKLEEFMLEIFSELTEQAVQQDQHTVYELIKKLLRSDISSLEHLL